jgi:DeoR family glycerol-3-phosphate regulon repressor
MSSGLSQPRIEEILRRLDRDRRLSAADLAADLGVSHETIRRDLTLLEENGKLRRVHGGAVLPQLQEEPSITERHAWKQLEKSRVAIAAAGFVEAGMSIFLDTGTTTIALAHRLVGLGPLSVMTNSLDIAVLLARDPAIAVSMVPGVVRRNDNAVLGHAGVEWADGHFFDIAFMGIGGIDLDQEFMDHETGEAQLRRALVRRCRRSVIMADDSKFGRKGFVRTVGFGAVTTLVTNAAPAEAFLSKIAAAKTELVTGRAAADG